jgi:hypothetical protein
MNVELQNISINRPVVKINTELKVIDRPSPPEPPIPKFDGIGNAKRILFKSALFAIIGSATVVE